MLAGKTAGAADIDLFAWANTTSVSAANVLLVMDNAANFSASVTEQRCSITAGGVVDVTGSGTAPTQLDKTAGAVEQCALYSVVKSLSTATGTLNIGVMMFAGSNSSDLHQFNAVTNTFSAPCSGTGGCLVMPIVEFTPTVRANMLEWIRQWDINGNSNYVIKGNRTASAAVMQEAWAYFKGKTGVSGRDYSGITPPTGCGRNNVIFIGNDYRNNATPGDQTGSDGGLEPLSGLSSVAAKRANPAATAAEIAVVRDVIAVPPACGGSVTLETNETKGVYALNWAQYMKAEHDITSFAVAVLGPTCNAEYAAHLMKMGELGSGGFFGTNNYDSLVAAMNEAISKILAVNSVFAAVSLPVSVNTQGSYLNQVYVGMFRPQDSFMPRWNGNLKQYKLGYPNGATSGTLRLLDGDGKAAINNLTGFITECARSYWTPGTVDTYWAQQQSGGCTAVANSKASDYPDGNIVEKGGQSYMLRHVSPPTARTVKTCSATFASCTSLTDFSTSNSGITQDMLNSGGSDRDTLINWARGVNTTGELDKTVTTTIRPSAHGDVVHSRPVAINHGTDAAPSIVVYYGGNDGALRAVNGNRTADINSGGTAFAAGSEMWSFIPPEFYGSIKRIYDDSPAISFPGSTVAGARAKNYGMDGPITGLQSGGSTYVYATMRRGGRAMYGFNVSTPGSPSLLWKKGCPNLGDDTNCSSGFTGIGQTWSSLKSLVAMGYGSGNSPMLITGGGYDPCEDFDARAAGGANNNCTATPKGNGVYLLDAVTGSIVASFTTTRSVVADSTIVRDSNGKATLAYTADMGGNVYRISLAGNTTATWSITKIASLGCDTASTCTANRKFMFAPSVTTADNGVTYNILLGSGDREKPVEYYAASKAVTNYFFMIKDKPAVANWLTDENVTCSANLICKSSLLAITSDSTPSDAALAAKKGWYLALASTEQVVTSAVTVFGVTTFSTHQPALTTAASCSSNLGTTLVYNIGYTNAASANGTDHRFEDVSGDGLPPSPVAGRVILDSGQTVPFCIGCSKDSPLEGSPPKELGSVTQPKGRLFWYIQK
ncbi:MAG TPA: pilus assembly protein PilY [Ramlibacter sp.]|nr:pilus assembly protein PilY [Ramlibacter sp.]